MHCREIVERGLAPDVQHIQRLSINGTRQADGRNRVASPTAVEYQAVGPESLDAGHRLPDGGERYHSGALPSGQLLLNEQFQLPIQAIAVKFGYHVKNLLGRAHGRSEGRSVSLLIADSLAICAGIPTSVRAATDA